MEGQESMCLDTKQEVGLTLIDLRCEVSRIIGAESDS